MPTRLDYSTPLTFPVNDPSFRVLFRWNRLHPAVEYVYYLFFRASGRARFCSQWRFLSCGVRSSSRAGGEYEWLLFISAYMMRADEAPKINRLKSALFLRSMICTLHVARGLSMTFRDASLRNPCALQWRLR